MRGGMRARLPWHGKGRKGDSEGSPLPRRVPRMRGVGVYTPSIFRWPFLPRDGRHGGRGEAGWPGTRHAGRASGGGKGADAIRRAMKGPWSDGRGEDGEIPVRMKDRAQRGL